MCYVRDKNFFKFIRWRTALRLATVIEGTLLDVTRGLLRNGHSTLPEGGMGEKSNIWQLERVFRYLVALTCQSVLPSRDATNSNSTRSIMSRRIHRVRRKAPRFAGSNAATW